VHAHVGLSVRALIERYLGPLANEEYAAVYQAQLEFQLRMYRQYLTLFPGVLLTLQALKSQGKTSGDCFGQTPGYLTAISARNQNL
jgi:phosphoglycolate phosphatase-like HAD superfamily hydrolase